MVSIEQARLMATTLCESMKLHNLELTPSSALEIVSHQLGYQDWKAASAALEPEATQSSITFEKTIPILRIFDVAKAREFYLGFLDFNVEFEHRFEADFPLYMGISRNGLQLHLSEHHGDACPGATLFVPMHNIEVFRDALREKNYGYGRPDIVQQDWGKTLEVCDPFGNRIRFCER
ncbi:glyoxalase superfamily protein [Erwinia sp.]|uniref:glyoxalase superfamily protein n=1 Tax=Erwinia citreus TaxID=558 RepID=UPI003C77CC07